MTRWRVPVPAVRLGRHPLDFATDRVTADITTTPGADSIKGRLVAKIRTIPTAYMQGNDQIGLPPPGSNESLTTQGQEVNQRGQETKTLGT